jgi:hypothetical protein
LAIKYRKALLPYLVSLAVILLSSTDHQNPKHQNLKTAIHGVNTPMKINLKALIAVAVIIGAVFWAVDSVRTRSYSGTDLNFIVGRGAITVTNPSDEAVPMQLTGTGARAFVVSSTTEVLSGSATRPEGGANNAQVFVFDLPPGEHEFSVVSSSSAPRNVSLVASSDIQLEATSQPLAAMDANATMIAAAVVVLGALFYISRATNHGWLRALRGKKLPIQVAAPVAETLEGGQGRTMRSYGDNTAGGSN